MINVVYPLTNQNDYTELKFSLRSVEKFVKQPFKVIIVGDKIPAWITGVTVIGLADVKSNKLLSVRRKILVALEYAKQEIVFFNDDFYLMDETDFPYYFDGDLRKCVNNGSKNLQAKLKELKLPIKHFDLHYPIIYDTDFKELIQAFPVDCLNRSAYCNAKQIAGQQNTDRKFLKEASKEVIKIVLNRKLPFSSGANSLSSLIPFLNQLYPDKSKFEL